jgi:hypothetical protein
MKVRWLAIAGGWFRPMTGNNSTPPPAARISANKPPVCYDGERTRRYRLATGAHGKRWFLGRPITGNNRIANSLCRPPSRQLST